MNASSRTPSELLKVLPVGTRVGAGKVKAAAVTELVLVPWEGKQAYVGQVRWPDGKLSLLDAHWLPEWVSDGCRG